MWGFLVTWIEPREIFSWSEAVPTPPPHFDWERNKIKYDGCSTDIQTFILNRLNHLDKWIKEFNRSKDLEATALPPGHKNMCLPYDDNGDDDDDDGVGYDDDDGDDESYSEDKEANSELQTKVITAIDNWPFPFILMVDDDDGFGQNRYLGELDTRQ